MLEESLLVYGPLGVMVVGLGWAVVYLWKALQSANAQMITLLQGQIKNEEDMQVNYTKLCMQLQHSLEILTERLSHVTTEQGSRETSS